MSETNPGKDRIKIIVAGVIFVAAGGVAWYTLGGDSAYQRAAVRGYSCNDCGQSFDYTPKEGDREPYRCPHCKAMAGYPAERCYWTKGPDGAWKAKLDPTYVILKQWLDPNTRERTYCPDCGREVVGHNPLPPEELMEEAEAEAGKR